MLKRIFWSIIILLLSIPLGLMLGIAFAFYSWYPQFVKDFDHAISKLNENTVIYDYQNKPHTIIEGIEDRQIVPRQKISKHLQLAVLAIEDARFFQHRGFDVIRIFGALYKNLHEGGYQQGGSTITQQLIKVIMLSPEKTITRKLKEVFMAFALEIHYPKKRILEYYLNTIYLGFGNYGVEQAARFYFNKAAADLKLEEAAFIAGLINRPEYYFRLPENFKRNENGFLPQQYITHAMQRQKQVLQAMREAGWISQMEFQEALKSSLQVLFPFQRTMKSPFFVQHVRSLLSTEFNLNHITTGGYKIHTTLHPEIQSIAEKLIQEAIEMPNSSFSEAAMVAIEPHTGYVRAIVGGGSFDDSEFNRATQANRQPGSAFKAFVYATAFEKGFKASDSFVDEPVHYSWGGGPDDVYSPKNYDRLFGSERRLTNQKGESYYSSRYTLYRAFGLSINTIAVQLLHDIGVKRLVKKSSELGLSLRKDIGLCLALGCNEVKLLSFAAAYTPFMNEGYYSPPTFITNIEDNTGKELYQHEVKRDKPVFSPSTVQQMKLLFQGVVQRGTGKKANWSDNSRYLGGKTGTSSDLRDAWFIGFTPELIAGFWIGNDDNSPLVKETGGNTPALLFSKFMQQALPLLPERTLPEDHDVVYLQTCTVSGELATSSCPDTALFPYNTDDMPYRTCHVHPGVPINNDDLTSGTKFSKELKRKALEDTTNFQSTVLDTESPAQEANRDIQNTNKSKPKENNFGEKLQQNF